MVKAFALIQTVISMKDHGSTENRVERELNCGQMVINIKDNGNMENPMERE